MSTHAVRGACVVETCGGLVWLADGVVVQASRVSHLELQHARAFADGVPQLVGPATAARLVADMRFVRWVSADARADSASDEMTGLVGKLAILVGSPVTRVIASFFVRVAAPPFPARLFTSFEAAVAWLSEAGSVARVRRPSGSEQA